MVLQQPEADSNIIRIPNETGGSSAFAITPDMLAQAGVDSIDSFHELDADVIKGCIDQEYGDMMGTGSFVQGLEAQFGSDPEDEEGNHGEGQP